MNSLIPILYIARLLYRYERYVFMLLIALTVGLLFHPYTDTGDYDTVGFIANTIAWAALIFLHKVKDDYLHIIDRILGSEDDD